MKLILDNVDITYKALLAEMVKALHFKVTEIELTEQEEEQALYAAMQDGQKSGMATEAEKSEFEKWLFNN
jgi:hypothetical protein